MTGHPFPPGTEGNREQNSMAEKLPRSPLAAALSLLEGWVGGGAATGRLLVVLPSGCGSREEVGYLGSQGRGPPLPLHFYITTTIRDPREGAAHQPTF